MLTEFFAELLVCSGMLLHQLAAGQRDGIDVQPNRSFRIAAERHPMDRGLK